MSFITTDCKANEANPNDKHAKCNTKSYFIKFKAAFRKKCSMCPHERIKKKKKILVEFVWQSHGGKLCADDVGDSRMSAQMRVSICHKAGGK